MSTTPDRAPPIPCAASLAHPLPVNWLWPGCLAAGRLTVIDGDPGEGKSLLALDIASRLSAKQELPDGYRPAESAAALLLTVEDDLHETIVPRLKAAGADLDRVFTWTPDASGPLVFPQACARLKEMMEQTRVRLVVLDPFFAFLGPDISSLNDLMIRQALSPLAELAATTGAAFILIRHLRATSASRPLIADSVPSPSSALPARRSWSPRTPPTRTCASSPAPRTTWPPFPPRWASALPPPAA